MIKTVNYDQGFEEDKATVSKCFRLLGLEGTADLIDKESNFEWIKTWAIVARHYAFRHSKFQVITILYERGLIGR